MKKRDRGQWAVIALALLMSMSALPNVGLPGSAGPTPEHIVVDYVQADAWTDSLDDLSHVYVPQAGLVGIEVAGGAARLKAGCDEGWIASSVITCPEGNRYDLVVLEVDTPGESSVEISVLNATEEASEVGYANGTIDGYIKVAGSDLMVYGLSHSKYPRIRIQVNLVADGSDRPRLLSWSLHYVGLEEWREEFLGTSKMDSFRNLVLEDGLASIDLTGKSSPSGTGYYEEYPPVLMTRYDHTGPDSIHVFRANAARDGYQDIDTISVEGTYGLEVDDLNGDGHLDIIMANRFVSSVESDSQIYWGDGEGSWDTQNPVDLNTDHGYRVRSGDVNGDGWKDLVFVCNEWNQVDAMIFLNNGDGSFDYEPDIKLSEAENQNELAVGDVNGDGYDDIVFITQLSVKLFWGSEDGPSDSSMLEMSGEFYSIRGALIDDVDMDGYNDIVIACYNDGKSRVYLGDADGMDATVDLKIENVNSGTGYSVDTGDVNGDGYKDIVMGCTYGTSYIVGIYEGSASGIGTTSSMEIDWDSSPYCVQVVDVDRDGYDDIVGAMNNGFKVYMGGETVSTTPSVSKIGPYWPYNMAVCVPKGESSTCRYHASLVTKSLYRNDGKAWDMANIEGTFPQGTSVEVTVLDNDMKPVEGYRDLTDTNVDLAGLGARKVVHLKVEIASESNDTTPVLDSILVKWMDEDTWRDEFFGPAKISRTLGFEVRDGKLVPAVSTAAGPQLLVAGLRGDDGSDTEARAFFDAGGLDYHSTIPMSLGAVGASAIEATDLNGDGHMDVLFAVPGAEGSPSTAKSPLFLGTALGWRAEPDHQFVTQGASDVLARDINGDGHVDVVFAQERKGDDFHVNSTLYWGTGTGWSDGPDVEFVTTGASGVDAADLDGDGDLDLAFSCYRSSSTATDSMVFLQEDGSFDGSTPDHRLPTKGATAVAAADLDGDGRTDLVFANSFSGGFAEVDSYVYWGIADGGFDTTPGTLPTSGASDVAAADLDDDGDVDLVFANSIDNNNERSIDSFVYTLGGSRTLPTQPSARLPTIGASAVAVGDIDGVGRKDVLFACHFNGTGFDVHSRAFLGDAAGWDQVPDVDLAVPGATDVAVAELVHPDAAGYMSKAITVDPFETGAFDTLYYDANVGPASSAEVKLVDAQTWEVLASTEAVSGGKAWRVAGEFHVKEHPSVRVVVTATGLASATSLSIDVVWINWTDRVLMPPTVEAIELEGDSLLRTKSLDVTVRVRDEFDPAKDLDLVLQHRLEGEDDWCDHLFRDLKAEGDVWTAQVLPRADAPCGEYALRARLTDSDGLTSPWFDLDTTLEVLNNLPTAPEVRISPSRPVTSSKLYVEVVHQSTDVESNGLTYRYSWFMDGVLQEDLTSSTVPSERTARGQNWTVRVRAWDGDGEGPEAVASKVIQNQAPTLLNPLPDVVIDEDSGTTEALDLSGAFTDKDGDAMIWEVSPMPHHVTVGIDPDTGMVTITPDADWNGEETLTFVASDGELQVTDEVTVTVVPVNDLPEFIKVDGKPIESVPIVYTIGQGSVLLINVTVIDVEGHELYFEANTTMVDVDSATGEVRFEPDNDAVGTLRFALRVSDIASPNEWVALDIVVHVENENDPMDEPRINRPAEGEVLKANRTFSLGATCIDPDVQWGQVLNFSWSSNVVGHLGYGSSLSTSLAEPGEHIITLTVTDGEFQKVATVTIVIEAETPVDPNPNPNPEPQPNDGSGASSGGGLSTALIAGVLVVIIAATASAFVVTSRRRQADEGDEPEEEPIDTHEALRQMAEALKNGADALEESKNGNGSDGSDEWVESETRGVKVSSGGAPDVELSMKAQVTREASDDIKSLWSDIEPNGSADATGDDGEADEATDEEREQLRLDNLKRKYHNAIGTLPYGIPSSELKDRDWNELASLLATGDKRTVEGDREVTLIDGRWYHSDISDPASFLKEHGAKPKERARRSSGTDRDALLAKLEERFILGEISEEAYMELKAKYE